MTNACSAKKNLKGGGDELRKGAKYQGGKVAQMGGGGGRGRKLMKKPCKVYGPIMYIRDVITLYSL